jgi:protein-tyrosine phosphatase
MQLPFAPAWFHPRILVGSGNMLTPQFVEKYRISHVINCAFSIHSPRWFRSMHPDKYYVLEALDDPNVNILHWYPRFERVLHDFLQEGNQTIFVHCQAGINRSGFLSLLYVCKNFSMDMDTVISATRRQRPILYQNRVFMNQATEFINGRVPREEDSGNGKWTQDGDAGLGTSGGDSDPTGIDDDAVVLERRTE